MEEQKLHISSRESSSGIFFQVLPTYLLAGLGMVTAGMLLDHVQVSDTLMLNPTALRHQYRAPSRFICPSGIRGKPWQQHDSLRVSSDKPLTSHCPSVSLHSARSLDGHPCAPLIKMRKGHQSGQAHTGHQLSAEEKEKEVWRERDEKERQHRRAEKKLLAFWMSLSHRTWTLFRPRERPGFQRSTSASRLLKSEA
ncbi:hypothetical protein ABVT39_014109 [Epinephelus coioides]